MNSNKVIVIAQGQVRTFDPSDYTLIDALAEIGVPVDSANVVVDDGVERRSIDDLSISLKALNGTRILVTVKAENA